MPSANLIQSQAAIVAALLAISFAALLVAPSAANAVAPANDDFPGTAINAIPYQQTIDTSDATVELDEPFSDCGSLAATAWWSFTPDETGTYVLRAESDGSFPPFITVWTESTFPGGGLAALTCDGWPYWPGEPVESLVSTPFQGDAGETYYFQLGGFDFPGDPLSGPVTLSLNLAEPPEHDDLADAVNIGTLPFEQTVDITGATTEPDEPQSTCLDPDGFFGTELVSTVWYEYTPAQNSQILIDLWMSEAYAGAAVWSGTPGNLTEESGCGSLFIADVQAGETLYIQAGEIFDPGFAILGGILSISITEFSLPGCPATGFEISDPVGDYAPLPFGASSLQQPSGDITAMRAGTGGGTTCLTFDFNGSPVANELGAVFFNLAIDADSDPETGGILLPDPQDVCGAQGPIGIEQSLLFVPDALTSVVPLFPYDFDFFGNDELTYAVISMDGNELTIAFPTAAIGDGEFDLIVWIIAFGETIGAECLPEDGVVSVTQPVVPSFGDLNCDGVIDAADATVPLAYSADLTVDYHYGCTHLGEQFPHSYSVGGTQPLAGDVNCDSEINLLDALLLLTWTAGNAQSVQGCPPIGAEPVPV